MIKVHGKHVWKYHNETYEDTLIKIIEKLFLSRNERYFMLAFQLIVEILLEILLEKKPSYPKNETFNWRIIENYKAKGS